MSAERSSVEIFEEHRDLLRAVAYRMLGSVGDAEDVVQETWLRWQRTERAGIADPRAYLVRVATRLALDHLRRLKTRRESYLGPWLPEPISTGGDLADDVEVAESVSLALLVVLETLSPLERAVFVLREAFGFPYAEIAAILERSEPAVRQLARRARGHIDARRPRFEADPEARRRVTERFLAAATTGDLQGLLAVLAPGVTLVADGGGHAPAPRRPIEGAARVARFLVGVARAPLPDQWIGLAPINGESGIVVVLRGAPIAALVLDVAEDAVRSIYLVANPDKLVHVRADRAG